MALVLIALLVILIAVLLYLFMLAPGRYSAKQKETFSRFYYAHRGLHSKDKAVPENSLAAFALAKEAGYGVELDIRFTKDKQIVVFHDDDLKRVCGVEGLVSDFTYEELLAFDLCGTKEKIPLFSQVLSLLDGKVPMIIEYKIGSIQVDALCQAAEELLAGYKGLYCIESFNPFVPGWYRKHRPQVLRGQLSACFFGDKTIPLYRKVALQNLISNFVARPQFIAFDHRHWNCFSFSLCRALFHPILVAWTVRDTDDIPAITAGSDMIIFEYFRP